MDLKKSLFGGYRKDSVDAVIRQMQENEEQYQAKIALLDNEFRLSKEATQKNLESAQTELVIRQKSVSDLTRGLDERNARIAELEEQQRTIASEFEKQYGAILSEMKIRHDAALADMEEKYSTRIAGLEERSRQETVTARQTDDQVRKIGQLYVDAQEYTEKMKVEAKNKMMESIDSVFAELDKMQTRYEESFAQINEKKANLSRLVAEMTENLLSLQNKMDSMDSDKTGFVASFENISNAKEQIRKKIQNDNDNEREAAAKAPEPEKSPAAPYHERPAEPAVPSVDFSAQIEELKQKIERQERLLLLRTAEEARPAQEPLPSILSVESMPATLQGEALAMESVSLEEEKRLEEGRVFIPSMEEDSIRHNDKESLERENYNKYFEEIRKKYSKEPSPSPSFQETAPAASLPDALQELKPDENADDKTDNEETPISKKPSIKDILNKYANMK